MIVQLVTRHRGYLHLVVDKLDPCHHRITVRLPYYATGIERLWCHECREWEHEW
jgi:hypothetical protein